MFFLSHLTTDRGKKLTNDWQQWLPNKTHKDKVTYPNLNKVQKTLTYIFLK